MPPLEGVVAEREVDVCEQCWERSREEVGRIFWKWDRGGWREEAWRHCLICTLEEVR